MATESSGSLRQCLTDLVRADTSGDYQRALQSSNRMIRRFPKEHYAFKCKLVALIHLSQYDDALSLIKKTPPSQMGECSFEKAYIYYRLGKNEEALEALVGCQENDYRATELKAQILYKIEKFQEAYDLFRQLMRNHSDEYDEERKANYLAVQAQLESMGVSQQVDDGYETFEQLYNFACQEIESENLDSALIHLEKSLELCRFTLAEEGLSEEEIDDELSMIRVQRAFVLHKMGRRQEALDVYKRVQHASPSDVSVVATVINNIPGASQEFNLPDSRKKFKIALQVDQNKLTYRQRRTLMLNNALVLLLSNQREPCRRALDDLIHRFGLSKDVCLIEAALFVKLNEVGKALKVLESGDTQMKMTCIHVMLNNGMMNEALNALNSLPNEIRSLPAVVSLVTSVLIALDRKEDALKVLESSISVTQDPEGLRYLLNQAAELEASNNNMAGSCKYLEKLAELIPDDLSITCRLIRAYSEFNPKSAEVLSNQVFPETSDETLDVDSLENNDWILYGEKYRQKKEAKMEIEDTEIITRKLKNVKRKRKIRLPKNYDPSIQPDPERWLPKQERTAFKKKNKKHRDRDIGRGTQGSASTNPNVEFTSASPNSPRPVPATEGPRQMRPKQQPKKKKKGTKF